MRLQLAAAVAQTRHERCCGGAGTPGERQQMLRAHVDRAAAVRKLLHAAFAPHLPEEARAGFGSSIAPPAGLSRGLGPGRSRRDGGKGRGGRSRDDPGRAEEAQGPNAPPAAEDAKGEQEGSSSTCVHECPDLPTMVGGHTEGCLGREGL